MATTRIFQTSTNRHIHQFFLPLINPSPKPHLQFLKPQRILSQSHFLSFSHTPQNPKFSLFSSSIPKPPNSQFSNKNLNRVFFNKTNDTPFAWNFAPPRSVDDSKNPILITKTPEIAVVLLGWLGAKPKHLRKYVEMYNARGVHALTFVVSVTDVMSFDLGKRVERSVGRLTDEIVSWMSRSNSNNDRVVMFHTFSNTGWLAYGAILDNLKCRGDLLERIKGCVVDSGGDPNIDPKVWAAGFTTAILKKSSSATYSSVEGGQETQLASGICGSNMEEKEPFVVESFLLFAFEKLFSYLLNLPDINKRLTKIISGLSTNQPPCPQLYLYSSGDKVIPFEAVESFIEEQRKNGKQVSSFNFGSSPHVDHLRTFPDVYASRIHNFLNQCLVKVGQL